MMGFTSLLRGFAQVILSTVVIFLVTDSQLINYNKSILHPLY